MGKSSSGQDLFRESIFIVLRYMAQLSLFPANIASYRMVWHSDGSSRIVGFWLHVSVSVYSKHIPHRMVIHSIDRDEWLYESVLV